MNILSVSTKISISIVGTMCPSIDDTKPFFFQICFGSFRRMFLCSARSLSIFNSLRVAIAVLQWKRKSDKLRSALPSPCLTVDHFPVLSRKVLVNINLLPHRTANSHFAFSSCIWQLSCQVAIILLGHDYAADAVPLYQYTGTHVTNLGRMTG